MTTDTDYAAMLWLLDLGIRLLSIAYSSVLASGIMLMVFSWSARKRSLLFASILVLCYPDYGVPLYARLEFAYHNIPLHAHLGFVDHAMLFCAHLSFAAMACLPSSASALPMPTYAIPFSCYLAAGLAVSGRWSAITLLVEALDHRVLKDGLQPRCARRHVGAVEGHHQ